MVSPLSIVERERERERENFGIHNSSDYFEVGLCHLGRIKHGIVILLLTR
jgi:hypothetical protein